MLFFAVCVFIFYCFGLGFCSLGIDFQGAFDGISLRVEERVLMTSPVFCLHASRQIKRKLQNRSCMRSSFSQWIMRWSIKNKLMCALGQPTDFVSRLMFKQYRTQVYMKDNSRATLHYFVTVVKYSGSVCVNAINV